MSTKILIAFLTACCLAAGYPLDDDVVGEGVARQYRIAVEDYLKSTLNSQIDTSYDPKNVKFYLYTNQQPYKVELGYEDMQHSLKNSTYYVDRVTKIFIHDRFFSENYYTELVAAYLRHSHKPLNMITVDYSYYSGVEHKQFMQIYYREIGASLAKFVKELSHYGVTGDKVHVIGHGIGAHIAAVAARKDIPFKFNRITGLNPVGLEFDEDENLPQLQKRDADLVDVILTNTAELGSSRQGRGHINFYPNGGATQPQPQLGESDMLMSHLKSYFYYVESISRGKVFQAYAADSYANFKAGKYDRAKVNYMGAYPIRDSTGNFYLDVNSMPPYSVTNDPKARFEGVKLNETYFNLILGTKLAPWVFTPKNDPYFRAAVTNQKTQYPGFGEGQNQNDDGAGSKNYGGEGTLHYSVDEPRN